MQALFDQLGDKTFLAGLENCYTQEGITYKSQAFHDGKDKAKKMGSKSKSKSKSKKKNRKTSTKK